MSKYYILDDDKKPIKMSYEDTRDKIITILKNSTVKDGFILYNNQVFEFLELDDNGEKVRILKDVTLYYQLLKSNRNMHSEIEKLKEENISLHKDNLTKLYRIDYGAKLVEDYIRRAYNKKNSFSLVMADIDKFKVVNDTYGHEEGNRILEIIGKTILDNVRTRTKTQPVDNRIRAKEKSDIAIRYGGEEILILYKNISLDDTIRRVEELRKKISNIDFDGKNVTMSFGICNINEFSNAYDFSSIVEAADKALYNSKNNGRNRTSYYDYNTNIINEVKKKER